jgi:hypothetical protein
MKGQDMTEFEFVTDYTQLRPNDLLEHRCPRFGIVAQWRVVAVRRGATGVQSLIDVIPVTKAAPNDTPAPFSVTEQMTRNLTIIRRKD